jgi:hypothetical protein
MEADVLFLPMPRQVKILKDRPFRRKLVKTVGRTLPACRKARHPD